MSYKNDLLKYYKNHFPLDKFEHFGPWGVIADLARNFFLNPI